MKRCNPETNGALRHIVFMRSLMEECLTRRVVFRKYAMSYALCDFLTN